MNLLILSLIAVLGGIFLVVILILTATGKVKVGGRPSTYISLALLPLIITLIPVLTVYTINEVKMFIESKTSTLLSIPMWVILFEMIIFVSAIIIKVNIFPGSDSFKGDLEDKKKKMLGGGRRLLKYSIYTTIVVFLPAIIVIIYFLATNPTYTPYILSSPFIILETIPKLMISLALAMFGMVFAFLAAMGIIIAGLGMSLVYGVYITLACFICLMSLNGTIRMLYGSAEIRKKAVRYIILMIVPVVNIIIMLRLCHLAKKELNA